MARLALGLRAGELAFALAIERVVTVLPRVRLHPVALPPAGVVGLVAFRGQLLPVIDLGLLAHGVPCRPLRSTRLIVVQPTADSTRCFGLIAERVLDTIEIGATLPGLRRPGEAWLGEHVAGARETPQLVEPAALLTAELAAMIVAEPAA
jgi:chemotaxis-related protein WspB